MKRKLGRLCCICVLLLSSCKQESAKSEDAVHIVTSFYPIYLLAEEIANGAEGIVLENMAQPQTGCLHDYELTISDMKKLEKADILLINGGGMEAFLEQAIEQYPHIKIIDTSVGAHFLEASHDHEVGEEKHDAHEGEERNAHIWLNPENSVHQVEEIVRAMSEAVPEEKELFLQNGRTFSVPIKEISAETTAGNDSGEKVVLFHEGFGYLAELFGLKTVAEIYAEEYAEPSAKELAETIERAKAENVRLFLAADDSGRKYAELLAEECGGQVLILDPITTEAEATEGYGKRMEKNISLIQEALQKGANKR